MSAPSNDNEVRRTILVVEDEPTLATAIAQRLTNEGWTARVAGDGATAVKAADKLHPDLIIMDLMLPVMDGWQVWTASRQRNASRHNIPFRCSCSLRATMRQMW